MILGLPRMDPAVEAALKDARTAYQQAAAAVGTIELATAASLLRRMFGEDARRALVYKDTYESTMHLLVVLDADGDPLWFNNNRAETWGYPGVEDISDDHGRPMTDVDPNARYTVEDHLERNYDALSGPSEAFEAATSDHFTSDDHQLMSLDINAALALHEVAVTAQKQLQPVIDYAVPDPGQRDPNPRVVRDEQGRIRVRDTATGRYGYADLLVNRWDF